MQDNGGSDAFGRINRALDRIETHLVTPTQSDGRSEELEQLRDAHQRLRGRVEDAIVAIDRMLEER